MVLGVVVVTAALGLASACGSGSTPGDASSRSAGPHSGQTDATRSVVPRSLPPSTCPAPTTPPHGVTTTAASRGWPPLGYDPSALVRADVLSWSDGVVHLRWQPGQGVKTCQTGLRADTAWVVDASGYKQIHGPEIGAFIKQRLADLGITADGVAFLVEVSDDGRFARQLGQIPPG